MPTANPILPSRQVIASHSSRLGPSSHIQDYVHIAPPACTISCKDVPIRQVSGQLLPHALMTLPPTSSHSHCRHHLPGISTKNLHFPPSMRMMGRFTIPSERPSHSSWARVPKWLRRTAFPRDVKSYCHKNGFCGQLRS